VVGRTELCKGHVSQLFLLALQLVLQLLRRSSLLVLPGLSHFRAKSLPALGAKHIWVLTAEDFLSVARLDIGFCFLVIEKIERDVSPVRRISTILLFARRNAFSFLK
jgi:hypothetical protein